MANYSVKIQLNQETVADLKGGNFRLYAFKAVASSRSDGVPVVWFRSAKFNDTTTVSWETKYEGYVTQSDDIPNGKIEAQAAVSMDLGQKWSYRPGSKEVSNTGQRGALSILNQTTEKYACGISEVVGGESNPLCAFPLNGKGLDVMAPIQKVLLMFATDIVNTGTVIYQAFSEAILIDLTAQNSRGVAFDINLGWDYGNASWAKSIEASSELTPLLVEHSQPLADMANRLMARPEQQLLS